MQKLQSWDMEKKQAYKLYSIFLSFGCSRA